ncbi:C1 family peptidase [Hymenobacter sp. 5414T-23]|uniref:C1 family peptidase n=1 Tax=Hymenobacter sp. 5414T-23 TaxID=2932252 RepID=UPI001FD62A8B|nr:C1 family peptidase [Hymenobacter sp. 5414T-23]UOQ80991.1 C1 family peptidase [Hymenobacter sp. 5414T-23]
MPHVSTTSAAILLRILTAVALLVASTCSAVAQNDSISLRKFCPTKQWQEGATCASYATTYTALSTLHNVRNNVSDERLSSFKAFSYGFVASRMKQKKGLLTRAFSKCGLDVDAEQALDVLQQEGTVEFRKFPEYCACRKASNLLDDARRNATKKYTVVGDETSKDAQHIAQIKQALGANTPVITAILQTDFFRDIENSKSVFPTDYVKNDDTSNHVVCILGYNDTLNGGSFLVRNNYENWGDNGYCYIPYTDMIKLIRSSYIIKL